MSTWVTQINPTEVNLMLQETVASIIVTPIVIAIIATIAMIVKIEAIFATITIIKTTVMKTTVMKRSIASTHIMAKINTIVLMASEQITSRKCMTITASPTLNSAIICLNVTLVLPAADQITE